MTFGYILDKIFFNNTSVTPITVQIGDPPLQQPKTIKLNLNDTLLHIRELLENDGIIDNTLSFSKKISNSDEKINYKFSPIIHEEEFFLSEIVVIKDKNYFLYLINNSLDWKTLNKLHKLDYGCTMTFDGIKIAEKRAFVMKDCESDEIGVEGYKNDKLEFRTQNDWMEKTNLFFNVDAKITNFVKFGLSAGSSQNKNFNEEVKSSYNYIEQEKASLKLNKENLELTTELKDDVESAINSKNPEEFKKIIKNYGQFIATKVILGGRVYFRNFDKLSQKTIDKTRNAAANAEVGPLNFEIGNYSGNLERRSKFYGLNRMRLLGGEHPGGDFDEKNWIQSLENYYHWGRIKLQDPVSIFQLLPDDLRKKTYESIGKRILYSRIADYDYISNENREPRIVELTSRDVAANISEFKRIVIPENILEILLNKEAECNTFATVVDTEESKSDFFTCQILLPQDGKPSLIIHCIQRNIKRRGYKLKIGIMIAGYDINFDFTRSDFDDQLKVLKHEVDASSNQTFKVFNMDILGSEYRSGPPHIGIPVLNKSDSKNNSLVIGHHFYEQEENKVGTYTFSYCLKNHHYVNLPEFSIYTLIVSHYDENHMYGTLPLNLKHKHNIMWKKSTAKPFQPKYISLYSKGGYGPIFPKQKNGQIKIKYLECCNKNCSICKSKKLSEKNIECKYFDPCISFEENRQSEILYIEH